MQHYGGSKRHALQTAANLWLALLFSYPGNNCEHKIHVTLSRNFKYFIRQLILDKKHLLPPTLWSNLISMYSNTNNRRMFSCIIIFHFILGSKSTAKNIEVAMCVVSSKGQVFNVRQSNVLQLTIYIVHDVNMYSMCTHTCTHTCTYTHAHIHAIICTCTRTCIITCTLTCTYMHIHMYTHMHMHEHKHMNTPYTI